MQVLSAVVQRLSGFSPVPDRMRLVKAGLVQVHCAAVSSVDIGVVAIVDGRNAIIMLKCVSLQT